MHAVIDVKSSFENGAKDYESPYIQDANAACVGMKRKQALQTRCMHCAFVLEG